MPLRILFFGTPAFAVPSLLQLIRSSHEVVGVITQPDRPRGRGRHVTFEAVKTTAVSHGLTVFQPTTWKDPDALAAIAACDADLGVVAAYGRILPQRLLDVPRLGVINVHASLLPRWRGAAPVHRAILAGDRRTGVTIMRVLLALDAGPSMASVATEIDPDETSQHLEARLATLGGDLLVPVVDRLSLGPVVETAQDEGRVTYAARLERGERQVEWSRPARAIHDQIRGLQPWPVAAALLAGRKISFLRSTAGDAPLSEDIVPGTIVASGPDTIDVAARPGVVRIHELQPEGRPAMSVRAFLNGARVVAGDRFDPLIGIDA